MRTFLIATLGVAASCGTNDPPNDVPVEVFGSNTSQLVLAHSGGNAGWQSTSDCPVEVDEYTFSVANQSLSAFSCAPGATPQHALVRRSIARPLTAQEVSALTAKLGALQAFNEDVGCIPDGGGTVVTTTTPAGTTSYGTCQHLVLDGAAADAAVQAFHQLAFPGS